jgi:hypothetical protein
MGLSNAANPDVTPDAVVSLTTVEVGTSGNAGHQVL